MTSARIASSRSSRGALSGVEREARTRCRAARRDARRRHYRRARLRLDGEQQPDGLFEEARLALFAQRTRLGSHGTPTAADVLELATIGGASALGLDDEIGSLDVGKQADLVAFGLQSMEPTQDPVDAAIFSITGARTRFVMCCRNDHWFVTDDSSHLVKASQLACGRWVKRLLRGLRQAARCRASFSAQR